MPAHRIWPANETNYDCESATCVCVNTLLYASAVLHCIILINRSAVGVMVNNTLHHNARKFVFGEKTNALGSLMSLVFPQDS